MADALHGTDAQLQLTLTLYMVGYALSMLASGPLSDRYGRRPVLLGGLCLYVVASVACAWSASVTAIVAARIFQALGGCSGTVIGRVIVRERFPTAMQATMLGRISAGMALSPVIAPLAGSAVAEWLGWRGVFGLLAVGGLVATAMVLRYLPETRQRNARPAPRAASADVRGPAARAQFPALLARHQFRVLHVLPVHRGIVDAVPAAARRISPVYAAIFGLTVLGYLIGSNLFARIGTRWKADSVIAAAAGVNLASAAVLWIGGAIAPTAVAALVVPMFFVMIAVGIAIPACQFAVMQPYTTIAGRRPAVLLYPDGDHGCVRRRAGVAVGRHRATDDRRDGRCERRVPGGGGRPARAAPAGESSRFATRNRPPPSAERRSAGPADVPEPTAQPVFPRGVAMERIM